MEKFTNRADLIAAMTEDLAPVKRLKRTDGIALVAFAAVVAAIVSVAIFEFWTGIVNGEASGFFWITNGLLLLLGAASTSALVTSAMPRVGVRSAASKWSAAMIGVIPAAALFTLLPQGAASAPGLAYWQCAAYGTGAGMLVALAAVMFLRRGAPVSLERSGWLTGLAAGALGSVAYGITCPLDTIGHVGIVHVIPVAVSAMLGRLVVPSLIRW